MAAAPPSSLSERLNEIPLNNKQIRKDIISKRARTHGIRVSNVTIFELPFLILTFAQSGQQPFLTLFNSDFPQALEGEYGGFLSPKIEKDLANYAEVWFREFGDSVKHWITLNEPVLYSTRSYESGGSPPNGCSKCFANCTAGDSTTESVALSTSVPIVPSNKMISRILSHKD